FVVLDHQHSQTAPNIHVGGYIGQQQKHRLIQFEIRIVQDANGHELFSFTGAKGEDCLISDVILAHDRGSVRGEKRRVKYDISVSSANHTNGRAPRIFRDQIAAVIKLHAGG